MVAALGGHCGPFTTHSARDFPASQTGATTLCALCGLARQACALAAAADTGSTTCELVRLPTILLRPDHQWGRCVDPNTRAPVQRSESTGVQVREAVCVAPSTYSLVNASECAGSDLPDGVTECSILGDRFACRRTCTARNSWLAEPVGECSRDCSGGERKVRVTCKTAEGREVDPVFCDASTRPSSTEPCGGDAACSS